jgi:molecular chaperone DnaK (HSP70)
VGARFVVGIDLGTTHTVVAFAPLAGAEPPRVFPVSQLVARGEIEARPLFPSCLFSPPEAERADGDPWGDAPWIAGELARARGGEVPGRFVASAKSWLSHGAVDRTAAILPWGVDDPDVMHVSPVDASARYLAHVRAAWDGEHADALLAEQEVVLTVPASFDEVARELTVEAAKRAGLRVRLLEEPQAAFYDFMHEAGEDGVGELADRLGGDAAGLVLVVDVGGGTTDLSLLRVARGEGGAPDITRVAVGRHLLLGGDNMDLALAHACEPRLVAKGEKLDAARFGQLVLACRAAKERLLAGANAPDDVPVTVLGRGSGLFASAKTTRLERTEVESIVLGGFFPAVTRDARPERARTGLVAFGLPYERDAAITRHVASFFARHAPESKGPSAVLLNGGVFRARAIEDALVSAMGSWGGPPIVRLPNADPDLAVARGAVTYGLALAGRGARIGGGSARGYYVGVDDKTLEATRAVCVVPRGAEEGAPQRIEGRTFALTVGAPVRFDLFASDEARGDRPGDVVTIDDERFEALPPVATAIDTDAHARGPKELRVVLEGELTAIGTLELACVEIGGGREPRRFRLAFQLRAPSAARPTRSTAPPPSIGSARLEEAKSAIARAFESDETRAVKDLLRDLEKTLGERPSWTTELARALFDAIAPHARARRKTPDHERVFWLLAGYCVRPGFGDPFDPQRVRTLGRLFVEKVVHASEERVWQQFWIAWRRAAAGLDAGAQTQIRDMIDPWIAPQETGLKRTKKFKPMAIEDMIECASSLERVARERREALGDWVLERTWTARDPRLWASIGRIGARVPAYAGLDVVVPPRAVEPWLERLMREKWEALPTAPRAAVRMARVTDDRARDVSPRLRREVEKRLVATHAREEWIRAVREHVEVDEAERADFYGERLPVGLRLVE